MLKRRKPLEWIAMSDGSICVWWRNHEILVDQEDFRIFQRYYLCCKNNRVLLPDGSIIRAIVPVVYLPNCKKKQRYFRIPALHSIIMGTQHWQKVVHLNGNQLDCRKKNLRIWTQNTKRNWTKELLK
jgi:hypothetical protein